MVQWLTWVVLVVLAVLAFLWLQTDSLRLNWKGARRRARCPHRDPGIDRVRPLETPGEVKTVYYCPDCKHLWAEVSEVPRDEWERLVAREARRRGGGEPRKGDEETTRKAAEGSE
jgi:hypothetical protein